MVNQVSFCTVSPHYEGQRLDNFLFRHLKGVPHDHIYRAIRKGEVRVNKKRCKPIQRLQVQDEIRIPPLRQSISQQNEIAANNVNYLESCILYEDKDILAINKPAGLAVHGGSGLSYGVIEALRALRPKQSYLELAHRLDKPTSGCLLIAKKPSVLKVIQQEWKQGKVEKRYDLLVYGHWPEKLRRVDAPLLKITGDNLTHRVKVNSQGKSALTLFYIRERYQNTTLLEAHLKTGRTHQIRVHAAHKGYPIVGDERYGSQASQLYAQTMQCHQLCLHAKYLKIHLLENPLIVECASNFPLI